MDANHFDMLTRSLTSAGSRRGLLRGIGGAALGLATAKLPANVDARKKHKNAQAKKPKLNEFGCLNVGQSCRGNDDRCCSGICQGKTPRNGERDKSRCVGHHAGNCTAAQDICAGVGSFSCGSLAYCYRTTGNASFCGLGGADLCAVCTKDADCHALGFGPGSACVFCTKACANTGYTSCIPSATSV